MNKDDTDAWNDVEKAGEVGYCGGCGKKIWIYWHRNSNIINGGMDKCALCFSGQKKAIKRNRRVKGPARPHFTI